jgi:hypothetical protein
VTAGPLLSAVSGDPIVWFGEGQLGENRTDNIVSLGKQNIRTLCVECHDASHSADGLNLTDCDTHLLPITLIQLQTIEEIS